MLCAIERALIKLVTQIYWEVLSASQSWEMGFEHSEYLLMNPLHLIAPDNFLQPLWYSEGLEGGGLYMTYVHQGLAEPSYLLPVCSGL